VARLLQLASEARASGRHAVADQFTERAAELLDQIVREEPAKSSEFEAMIMFSSYLFGHLATNFAAFVGRSMDVEIPFAGHQVGRLHIG
jgi:hypothetical protein